MSFSVDRGASRSVVPYSTNGDAGNDRLSANAENPDPHYRLGCERERENDFKEAARLYALAAELNHEKAQLSLGDCYHIGRGVEQCDIQAMYWYERATCHGNLEAQRILAGMKELRQEFPEAARFYQLAADQGDTEAQYCLGYMYNDGRGVDRDIQAAIGLFRLAADRGHADAQYELGCIYVIGGDVEENYEEAARLFHLAALQGHAQAQFNLGAQFHRGLGVAQDDRQAARWYGSAAIQNNRLAQCNLGYLYKKGKGVNQDDRKAVRLYRQAAKGDIAEARCNLGSAYEKGAGVRRSARKAAKHYQLAAALGSKRAQRKLDLLQKKIENLRPSNVALIYSPHETNQATAPLRQRVHCQWSENDQDNVEQIHRTKRRVYQADLLRLRSAQIDKETAEWYQEKVTQGSATALYNLSLCYMKGKGVQQDIWQSLKLLKDAVDLEEPRAQYRMGKICERVVKDCEQAAIWYRRAALQGHIEAQYRLVKICMETKYKPLAPRGLIKFCNSIVPQELVKFCYLAASQGHAEAQAMLGMMYLAGRIIPRNIRAANLWAKKGQSALQAKNAASKNALQRSKEI